MKKSIWILLLLLLGGQALRAQWVKQSSGVTNHLNAVAFRDSLGGFCVGGDASTYPYYGIILRSADGGHNWATCFRDSMINITEVAVLHDTVWCFGRSSAGNRKIVSYDNGNTWTVLPMAGNIRDAHAYNGLLYYTEDGILKVVQGGVVQTLADSVSLYYVNGNRITTFNWYSLRVKTSSDGGSSWQQLIQFPFSLNFSSSQSGNSCLARYGDTILIKYTYPAGVRASFDQGANWIDYPTNQLMDVPSAHTAIVNDHLLVSSVRNPAPGGKQIVKISADAGNNWANQDTIGDELTGFYFLNDKVGFGCGDQGGIYKTTNGGGHALGVAPLDPTRVELQLFPNPVTDEITLVYNERKLQVKKIQVFSLQGDKIRTFPANGKKLQLKGIPPDIYLLRVETNAGTVDTRIVKL